jgi:hypothetical protein
MQSPQCCQHVHVARRGLFFSVTSTVCMHFESSAKAFWLNAESLKRIFEDAVVSVEAPATATAASLAASAAAARLARLHRAAMKTTKSTPWAQDDEHGVAPAAPARLSPTPLRFNAGRLAFRG